MFNAIIINIKEREFGDIKMTKRLEDFNLENRKPRSSKTSQVVPMQFENNEATKRVVMHSAKRVFKLQKEEIQALAYK